MGTGLNAPAALRLPEVGTVDVWRASLSAATCDLAALDAVLSPSERRHADRNVFAAGRRRCVTSRGLLRHMLGRYLGTRPDEVPIRIAEHGKPFVQHPLQFSVAHSGDVIAYAFCLGTRVGIDVERIDPAIDMSHLAERVFSDPELHLFRGLEHREKVGVLFAAWTRKEALLKALGEGLTKSMSEIELPVQRVSQPQARLVPSWPDHPMQYLVADVSLRQGYAAALATEGPVEHAAALMDIPVS